MPDSYPDAYGLRSALDPSGLVPYPCTHGLAEAPAGMPHKKRPFRPGPGGGELAPYGGLSWGRAKYLHVNPIGRMPVTCPVCRGEPRPADMTEPRA